MIITEPVLNARQLPEDEHGDDPMGATLLVSSLDGWMVGEDVDVFLIPITEANARVEIHASGDIVTRGDLMKEQSVASVQSPSLFDFSRREQDVCMPVSRSGR